ncbi:MAG: hypothetical protein KA354_07405 [Phycisphaerae bacterium]|nr:hypothetical protein [Phycisphaerae bacterium]
MKTGLLIVLLATILAIGGCSNSHCDARGCVDPSLTRADKERIWREYALDLRTSKYLRVAKR